MSKMPKKKKKPNLVKWPFGGGNSSTDFILILNTQIYKHFALSNRKSSKPLLYLRFSSGEEHLQINWEALGQALQHDQNLKSTQT